MNMAGCSHHDDGSHVTAALTGDERFDLELLRRATGYQRWVVRQFAHTIRGDLLEVGAGIGNFTRWLAPMAALTVACEPDAEMCDRIRGLRLPNVEVVPAPVESLPGEERFDCVAMFNVLEHIEGEHDVLSVLFRLLRPHGTINVLVPAHRSLLGSLDRRYEHLRRYTAGRLRGLLTAAGFESIRARYFNPVGAVGWFLAGRVFRVRRLSRLSVQLSEEIAVPLGRLLERLGAPPFGQSVVATGTRPPATGRKAQG
jgi:SAM-dependent methyltransferase